MSETQASEPTAPSETQASEPTAPSEPGRGVSHLLDDLTGPQRRAVTTEATSLCVLAGAGSGKTRVLTRRIAYRVTTGSADAGHVLALTFTRKAASELAHRLNELGLRERVLTGTFHGVAIAALRQHRADHGRRPPVLLERKARLLGPLVAARPALAGLAPSEVAGHLEWAQARLIGPDDLAEQAALAGRRLPVPAIELAALYRRYESEKLRRGVVDFDDVLSQCAGAIETDPGFAGAQRWQWRHLFVDEFQDLNPAQHRLLQAWLGARVDLCAVGDPNQAIYGWNGADPGLLADFPRRWPETEVVRLDDNHRCTPQIVAAAAAVLGDEGADLRSACRDGEAPEVRSFPDDAAEGAGVAAAAHAANRRGLPWPAMAVLARTNAQVRTLARALEIAGVPCRVPGSADLLTHPVTVRVLDDLRADQTRPARMAASDLAEEAAAAPPGAGRDVLEVLAELAAHHGALGGPSAAAASLADWLVGALARDRDGTSGPSSQAVTVCSFHRAKGLEWSEVWVCGLEEGLVPLGHATTVAALAEERRLLYVALTRAGTTLHASWAERRRFAAHHVPRRPSPWLDLIGGAGRDPAAPSVDVATWRARLAEQREQLRRRAEGLPARTAPHRVDHLGPGDPEVVAALRAWRTAAARGSGVPAHVLLHDRTLTALAALGPTTSDELLDVPGLGPVKVARYGPILLSLVAHHRASA